MNLKTPAAWVSPNGDFIGIPGHHSRIAREIVKARYTDETGDAEVTLEKHGWIKCTGGKWYSANHWLTNLQKVVLKEWARINNTDPIEFNGDMVLCSDL